MSDYQYSPFDQPRQIRVLQSVTDGQSLMSESQSGDSTLSCDLLLMDLDTDPDFCALSYTWGNSTLTHEIEVSGKSLKVTESLYHAARDVFLAMKGILRIGNGNSEYEGRLPLWIDGICINQEDSAEKKSQVALMGDIYRQAICVFTYIGPVYQEAECAGGLIYHCINLLENPTDDFLEAIGSPEQAGFPPKEHESYEALRKLLKLPWSGRAWIVQESAMARMIVMVAGHTAFRWTALATIVEGVRRGLLPQICVQSEKEMLSPDYMGPDYIDMQARLKNAVWTAEGHLAKDLCQLLRRCHSFLSSNPRDKVYAFLSMARDREELSIEPDYELPTRDVYIHTATRILSVGQNLDLLSSVRPDKIVDLPSWVPDWSSFNLIWGLNNYLMHTELLKKGLFRAGGTNPVPKPLKIDGAELTLRGVIWDELCLVVQPECSGCQDFTNLNLIELGINNEDLYRAFLCSVQTLLECCSEEMGFSTYDNSGGVKEAFWRTLIANVDDMGNEANHEYGEYYGDFARLQEAKFAKQFGPVCSMDEIARLRATKFATAMKNASVQRLIGLTRKGYIASVPRNAMPGDSICVLLGGRVPFVIRPSAQASRYMLLGDAYVHGIMKGEAIENVAEELMTDIVFD